MRLFFAIELTDAVRNCADALQKQLSASLPNPSYRWMKPEHFHVTLAFLGNVAPDLLPRLKDVAQTVCSEHDCTALRFKGLSTFGSHRRPRVLWIPASEYTGNNTLNGVGYELYSRCSAFVDIDASNKIIPHVTLGRLTTNLNKQLTSAVLSAQEANAEYDCGEMDVHSVVLMKSNLSGSGPRYELLERFPLKS